MGLICDGRRRRDGTCFRSAAASVQSCLRVALEVVAGSFHEFPTRTQSGNDLAPPLLRLPSTCTLNAFIFLNVPSLQRTTCWQLVTDRNGNQKLIP